MALAPTSTVALSPTTKVRKDALTTPFRYPWDCATIREAALWIHVDGTTKGTTDIAFSNLANPRISACQPLQWKQDDGGRQLNFSPAVCPSGWVAHLLATKTISSTTLSTAYCCLRLALSPSWHPHRSPGVTDDDKQLPTSHNYLRHTANRDHVSGMLGVLRQLL